MIEKRVIKSKRYHSNKNNLILHNDKKAGFKTIPFMVTKNLLNPTYNVFLNRTSYTF